MSKLNTVAEMPEYVRWRTDLLVGLALARLPELRVCKFADEKPMDILVVTEQGFCFFVIPQGFSSLAAGLKNVETLDNWAFPVDSHLIVRARERRSPVVFFLFDADTDHGRYLRLDGLPKSNVQELRFPIEHTITRTSVQKLIAEMQTTPITSRAS
jgi:hypothetical protein